MTDKRIHRYIFLLAGMLLLMGMVPGHALALQNRNVGAERPAYPESIPSPGRGSDPLTRVTAPGIFSLPVVQQGKAGAVHVSAAPETITEFELAAKYGNVGLLAHNYLAGENFFKLKVGQKVHLNYGENRVETYVVTEILRYQALSPHSPYSDFRKPGSTEIISAGQMFDTVYRGAHHLTFQTCIEQDGSSSWGRLFVIAVPLNSTQ